MQAYKEVLFIQPDFEQVHLQLAKVFLEKGEFEESFGSYVKALQLNPKITTKMKGFLFTFLQRASSELSAQQMDEKVKVFLSVTNEKNVSSLYSNLGKVYAKQGKFLEAISYNKEYCRIKLRRVLPDYLPRCMDKGRLVDPHFLLIGVMKCGTTSLYDYTCQHPKVLPASRKELRFLDWAMNEVGKQEMESRGFRLPDLYKELYISQLPPVIESEGFITGEATPGYWKIVDLEKLIHASFPQTKLLVIVRDPVKRAVSQYHMHLRNGKTKQTFQEIIESELQDLYDIKDWNEVIARTKSKNYLGHGLYVYALEKWMRIFSSEKLLVLNSKDLANNSDLVMEQVFQFLSLEKYSDIQYSEKNKGSYSSRVDENLIAKMYNFYRPHNQRLEELLGRKFNWS